jgi:hypothetical protein
MASTIIRRMTPKVPSSFWVKVFDPIWRRPQEADLFYQARQQSQYLTFPFVF